LRLLLDEMYPPALAVALRARGHDVESVHEPGHTVLGAADADVLAAAHADERVVVTENVRDYRPLETSILAGGSHHSGLVYTTDRRFPRGDPATLGRLVRALDALLREGGELRDRSVFLPEAHE
jgi:predicted nuclease of predicted toxin-antitoxin system